MESYELEALKHLKTLAGEIGCRMIGSPGNRAAAQYIAEAYGSAGLEVEYQELAIPDWVVESTRLELDGEPLEAYANTFSSPCSVTAPSLAVGTVDELEAAELSGKIAIFSGDLAKEPLLPKNTFYAGEREQKIIRLLEEKHPAALITVNPTIHGRWRLAEDADLEIPSATVPSAVGLSLVQAAGRMVHLSIAASCRPGTTSNVIGRLPGLRSERIVLCAHYDTKEDTPGAWDNASGTAALLTLAGRLAPRGLETGLEFISFTAEEYLPLGSLAYGERFQDTFSGLLAAVNMDGIGAWLASNTLAVFSASPGFEDLVSGLKGRYPGVVRVDPWPSSDHYTFFSRGVPSIALSSLGLNDTAHTPADTPRGISPARLGEVIRLVEDLVTALQDKTLEWCRPR
jgi:Iap family predicted aminopeptidase